MSQQETKHKQKKLQVKVKVDLDVHKVKTEAKHETEEKRQRIRKGYGGKGCSECHQIHSILISKFKTSSFFIIHYELRFSFRLHFFFLASIQIFPRNLIHAIHVGFGFSSSN